MEKYGVNGTLESWTTGYTPNFMTELRVWYCWSDAPPLEELLGAIASRNFGKDGKEMVLKAWDLFSQAIRLVPDTGPTMGTSNCHRESAFLPGAAGTDCYIQVFVDGSNQVDGLFRRSDQSLLAVYRIPVGLLSRLHEPDKQGRELCQGCFRNRGIR